MDGQYKKCKLITCNKAGGIFNMGEIYPFYHINGYPHMVIVDKKPFFVAMEHYEDGTYKIVGTWNDWENAEFKEVV